MPGLSARRATKPVDTGKFSWAWRRTVIIGTLLLCAWGLVHLTLWGPDSHLNETLATGYIALMGTVIGSYVFGAAWHDRGIMAIQQAQVEAQVPPEPDPPTESKE